LTCGSEIDESVFPRALAEEKKLEGGGTGHARRTRLSGGGEKGGAGRLAMLPPPNSPTVRGSGNDATDKNSGTGRTTPRNNPESRCEFRSARKSGSRPRSRERDSPAARASEAEEIQRAISFSPASGTWASHRAWRNTWLPAGGRLHAAPRRALPTAP
jgi:hypothetical protein